MLILHAAIGGLTPVHAKYLRRGRKLIRGVKVANAPLGRQVRPQPNPTSLARLDWGQHFAALLMMKMVVGFTAALRNSTANARQSRVELLRWIVATPTSTVSPIQRSLQCWLLPSVQILDISCVLEVGAGTARIAIRGPLTCAEVMRIVIVGGQTAAQTMTPPTCHRIQSSQFTPILTTVVISTRCILLVVTILANLVRIA